MQEHFHTQYPHLQFNVWKPHMSIYTTIKKEATLLLTYPYCVRKVCQTVHSEERISGILWRTILQLSASNQLCPVPMWMSKPESAMCHASVSPCKVSKHLSLKECCNTSKSMLIFNEVRLFQRSRVHSLKGIVQ